jgi:hypothetical protein
MLSNAAAPNEFYAISPQRYQIELWSAGGQLKRSMLVASQWLGAQAASGSLAPPAPAITSLAFDSLNNVIWVSGTIANTTWRPPAAGTDAVIVVGGRAVVGTRGASSGSGSVGGLTVTTTEAQGGHFDTLLDAIDANTGRVLASVRLREQIVYFLPDGYLFTWHENPDGVLSIVVSRARLVPTGQTVHVSPRHEQVH